MVEHPGNTELKADDVKRLTQFRCRPVPASNGVLEARPARMVGNLLTEAEFPEKRKPERRH